VKVEAVPTDCVQIALLFPAVLMTRRGAGAQLLLLVASLCWTGAGAQIHRKRVDESKKLTCEIAVYSFPALLMFVIFQVRAHDALGMQHVNV
jgi:hypothetical protein